MYCMLLSKDQALVCGYESIRIAGPASLAFAVYLLPAADLCKARKEEKKRKGLHPISCTPRHVSPG